MRHVSVQTVIRASALDREHCSILIHAPDLGLVFGGGGKDGIAQLTCAQIFTLFRGHSPKVDVALRIAILECNNKQIVRDLLDTSTSSRARLHKSEIAHLTGIREEKSQGQEKTKAIFDKARGRLSGKDASVLIGIRAVTSARFSSGTLWILARNNGERHKAGALFGLLDGQRRLSIVVGDHTAAVVRWGVAESHAGSNNLHAESSSMVTIAKYDEEVRRLKLSLRKEKLIAMRKSREQSRRVLVFKEQARIASEKLDKLIADRNSDAERCALIEQKAKDVLRKRELERRVDSRKAAMITAKDNELRRLRLLLKKSKR